MLREEWELFSAREKNIIVAIILTASAVVDMMIAVRLLEVMKVTGILDYVMESSTEKMIQIAQTLWKLLIG